MTLEFRCPLGHRYITYDFPAPLPEGAPLCPECFKVWVRNQQGVEKKTNMAERLQNLSNRYQKWLEVQKRDVDQYSEGRITAYEMVLCDLEGLLAVPDADVKPKRSKWHRMSEHDPVDLPVYGKIVLVRNPDCKPEVNVGYYAMGIWHRPSEGLLPTVTHWRELPKFKE